jgi:hypothetical protein
VLSGRDDGQRNRREILAQQEDGERPQAVGAPQAGIRSDNDLFKVRHLI